MLIPRRNSDYHWIRVPARSRPSARHMHATETSVPFSKEIDFSDVAPVTDLDRFSFAGALATLGVPATNQSPEEELLDLLRSAAEIEHGLMLQYLYATYSTKVLLIAGVLRMIAIEEMGHFL